jgi:hypothetical protein
VELPKLLHPILESYGVDLEKAQAAYTNWREATK